MISVIIPAFNSEATISRAINSVLAQTYSDYEIIVVDDGSTDGTSGVVRSYGNKVKYIYQENAGPAAARNTAITSARGQWLAFLDDDDEWLPTKLQKQIHLLEANAQLKWCCTNRYQTDGKRKITFGNEQKITTALQNRDYFESYFLADAKGQCPIITTCLMIHRGLFDELGGFDPHYVRGQDLDMWWRIAHHYSQIGYIAEPLALRHLEDENPVTKTKRLDAARGGNRRKLISIHIKLAKEGENFYDFKRYAKKQLIEGVIRALYFGHKSEARIMVNEFKDIFKPFMRFILLTAILFAPIVKTALNLLFHLIGKTARK
ncbi:MAG: hypothetical protein DRP56_02880 [Planctomycetota bacterium]|nr:MAG: hypothetical protein DRP56_02880 [Planctomycetota bacterium]